MMELGDDGILTKEAIGMIQTKWDDTLWELEVLLFQAAKAQRDAMIAAGYHKHEPVAELDLATTLHSWMAKQKFGTEGHERALLHAIVCCDWVSQQRFIKCLADIIHNAGWRKVPPEGEGPMCPFRYGSWIKPWAQGMEDYRIWLLMAQGEK